jgi:Protein of unknown function (DUF3306)
MSEEFLSRWSRLKRESTARPAQPGQPPTADSPSPALEPPPASAMDVSSLPAIESINAQSNVAAFLRAGVPDDLTRAALRNAWASDPAIRDFVGIAENQWDFNGEGTMAGFGSLSAEEHARYLAARALQAERAGPAPEVKVAAERESHDDVGSDESTGHSPREGAPVCPGHNEAVAQQPDGESHASAGAASRAIGSHGAPQAKCTHGSALPK